MRDHTPPVTVRPAAPIDRMLKINAQAKIETGFGKDGVVELAIHPTLVSADGKGGYYVFDQRAASGGENRVVAIHLHSSGVEDKAFGTNGEQELGSGTSLLQGVVLDARGRVNVLVSQKHASAARESLIVYRLVNGGLDRSFNGGGAQTITVPTPAVTSRTGAVAIGADNTGRILVAGTDDPAAKRQIWVVRLTETGTLDPGFARGVATNMHSGYAFDVARVTVDQANGNVVVIANKSVPGGVIPGAEAVPASGGIAVFRFDPNGGVDASFGTHGVAMEDGQDGCALDGFAYNGTVVVAGYSGNAATNMKPAIFRWQDNGIIDKSFGGYMTSGVLADTAMFRYRRIARDGTGRIVAVGSYRTEQNTPVTLVARFDADGKPDTAYGRLGQVSWNVQSFEPEIDPQGNAIFRAP